VSKDLKATSSNFDFIIQELRKVDFTKDKRISVTEWKEKRGLSSNGQIHLWFGQIAKKQGYQAKYIKRACKVMFGIDILLDSDTEDAQSTIRTLERVNYWDMDWATKIDVVSSLMVTSIFKTDEMKTFMEQMIFYWNDNGVPIKFKD